MGQGTRLQNITPPGVLANVGHYGQNLEALREEQEQEKRREDNQVRYPQQAMCYLPHTPVCHILISSKDALKTPKLLREHFP